MPFSGDIRHAYPLGTPPEDITEWEVYLPGVGWVNNREADRLIFYVGYEDGVPLNSASHPVAPWYRRLWFWLTNRGLNERAIETVEIEIKPVGGAILDKDMRS